MSSTLITLFFGLIGFYLVAVSVLSILSWIVPKLGPKPISKQNVDDLLVFVAEEAKKNANKPTTDEKN